MLSLKFPVPIENTLVPAKSRTRCSSTFATSRFQTPPIFLSSPYCRQPLSFSANVALRDGVGNVGEKPDERINALNGDSAAEEEYQFPATLKRELIPRHVAVIMDGNGRWAKQRGLPPSKGHEAGVHTLRRLVESCARWGVKVLTVFAFSTDNWLRPKIEVEFLMSLFGRAISSELDNFIRDGIRISIIGDTSKLSESLQRLIENAEEVTKNNTRLQLIVAVSYSGKYDVLQACKSIAQKVKDGLVELEEIDEKLIEQELETNCTEFPNPDLLIRTSGELRVSNFLLWQLAYTELFFVREMWPDFGKEQFVEALSSYQQRQRRYGGRIQ